MDPSLTITIATGAMIAGPATEGLRVYEVQEVGGELQLRAWARADRPGAAAHDEHA